MRWPSTTAGTQIPGSVARTMVLGEREGEKLKKEGKEKKELVVRPPASGSRLSHSLSPSLSLSTPTDWEN